MKLFLSVLWYFKYLSGVVFCQNNPTEDAYYFRGIEPELPLDVNEKFTNTSWGLLTGTNGTKITKKDNKMWSIEKDAVQLASLENTVLLGTQSWNFSGTFVLLNLNNCNITQFT